MKNSGGWGSWGFGSPLVLPLARPSSRGLLEPCRLHCRKRESGWLVAGRTETAGLLVGQHPLPHSSPRPKDSRVGPRRWETQCLHRALSPGPNRRAREILTTLGSPATLQEVPTVSLTQPHSTSTQQLPGPATRGLGLVHVPRARQSPCASLCRARGPGLSAPAPASTGHSPAHLKGLVPAGSWAWDRG